MTAAPRPRFEWKSRWGWAAVRNHPHSLRPPCHTPLWQFSSLIFFLFLFLQQMLCNKETLAVAIDITLSHARWKLQSSADHFSRWFLPVPVLPIRTNNTETTLCSVQFSRVIYPTIPSLGPLFCNKSTESTMTVDCNGSATNNCRYTFTKLQTICIGGISIHYLHNAKSNSCRWC